jgi:hypothetical protein
MTSGGLFQVNDTTILDQSRNLSSIGTISSGAITTSAKITQTNSGELLRNSISSWGGNSEHTILHNGWNSTIADYLIVKNSGNGTVDGAIVIADNVFAYGGHQATGGAAASLTAPLSSSTAFTVTSSGNATFAGTIVSNASSGITINTSDATYAKIKQDYSSADILELTSMGSMQFAIDENNNSTNKYFIWKTNGEGSGGTQLMSLSDTGVLSTGASGSIAINGTEVITSARNLTNIGSITSAGTHQITSVSTSFNPFLVRYNSTYSNNNLARIRQDGAASIFNLYDSSGTGQVQFGTNTNNYIVNGNTGIGTSSPSVKFHAVASGSGTQFYFQSPTPKIRGIDSNLTTRYWEIGGENGSCNIAVDGGNAQGSSTFGVTIDGAQALYIDDSDRNYVNTTSNPTPSNATGHFNVLADLGDGVNIKHTVNGNNTINIWQTGTTVHSAIAFYKGNTQTNRGTIRVDTNGTSYTSASDYRLKENVVPISNATTRVMAMNPVQFDWIETGDTAEGFIAHELAEQCPAAVVGEKDAVYGNGDINPQNVDPGKITPLLVKTIQEQQALIESLQTRIEALEGE